MTAGAARTVQYHKWGGILHWRHDMVLLGEDDHGWWLGAPTGSIVQRGDEPPVVRDRAYVQLIRPSDPWTALFDSGGKYEVYIDLITPATWVDDTTVEMIDLDLDVVRRVNGEVALLDEDEWAEHIERFGYPAELIDQTETAAAELVRLVESRVEPFGSAALPWLAQLA